MEKKTATTTTTLYTRFAKVIFNPHFVYIACYCRLRCFVCVFVLYSIHLEVFIPIMPLCLAFAFVFVLVYDCCCCYCYFFGFYVFFYPIFSSGRMNGNKRVVSKSAIKRCLAESRCVENIKKKEKKMQERKKDACLNKRAICEQNDNKTNNNIKATDSEVNKEPHK